MALGIQLPITIFTQIALTSSKKVMGAFTNRSSTTAVLLACGIVVTALNVALLVEAL